MTGITSLKYETARNEIMGRIHSDLWREGDKLPPLPLLAREFNMSIWAVDKALQELIFKGVLFRQPKKGTFVRRRSLEQAFTHAPVAIAGITPAHWADSVYMGPLMQAFSSAIGVRPWFFFPYTDEKEIIKRLKREGVSALMAVIPTINNIPALEKIASSGIGVLSVSERIDSDRLHFITMDNHAGVRAGLEYLAQLGHRRIGFFGVYTAVTTLKERADAFREQVERLGLDGDPELLVFKDAVNGVDVLADETFNSWMSVSRPPTAVFCASGFACSAMLESMAERGVSFPADISLITFDDLPNSSRFAAPLTVIKLPVREMGEQAARLLPLIAAGMSPPARVVLPVELVVRASCATLARERS